MGAVIIPLRVRWTGAPVPLVEVQEGVLDYVLHRLAEVVGSRFDDLVGLSYWRWSLDAPRGEGDTLELHFDAAWVGLIRFRGQC
jgi:hypothetical protein